MRKPRQLLALSLCILAAYSHAAPDSTPPPKAETQPQSKPVALPIYVPPSRGASGRRLGAATRGIGPVLPTIELIAPGHAGLTARAKPTLYWHLSEVSQIPIQLTVVAPNTAEPLLSVMLSPPIDAGLHALRLAELDVTLTDDVDYRWHAALVVAPEERSRDVVSTAGLRRESSRADTPSDLAALAAAGLWYDTFAALQEQLGAADGEQANYLRRAQGALMGQIGLDGLQL